MWPIILSSVPLSSRTNFFFGTSISCCAVSAIRASTQPPWHLLSLFFNTHNCYTFRSVYVDITSWFTNNFRRFRKIAKSDSYLRHFCLSICPSVRPSALNNSAPTGQNFMKFDLSVFFKICWENSSFIKIWQEKRVLYMKTNKSF